jgi:hypothetical protein
MFFLSWIAGRNSLITASVTLAISRAIIQYKTIRKAVWLRTRERPFIHDVVDGTLAVISEFLPAIHDRKNIFRSLNVVFVSFYIIEAVAKVRQQYFSYIVVDRFIGGGNQSTRRKPPTCRKLLTNFITSINV